MKNKTWVVTAILASALLAGCATPVKNYMPSAIEISHPPLGEISVAFVGDNMLQQGKYIELDAIRLNETVTLGIFGPYTLRPGYYLKEGEDKKFSFLQPEPGPEGGAIEKKALADPYKAVAFDKGTRNLCVVTAFNARVCTDKAKLEHLKRPALTSDGFQQTLIYSGRVGNKINIGYREFSNHVARPAFNNDVEYDLDESSTIGYRGAELEIIEATNRQVTYQVITNFNQATR